MRSSKELVPRADEVRGWPRVTFTALTQPPAHNRPTQRRNRSEKRRTNYRGRARQRDEERGPGPSEATFRVLTGGFGFTGGQAVCRAKQAWLRCGPIAQPCLVSPAWPLTSQTVKLPPKRQAPQVASIGLQPFPSFKVTFLRKSHFWGVGNDCINSLMA